MQLPTQNVQSDRKQTALLSRSNPAHRTTASYNRSDTKRDAAASSKNDSGSEEDSDDSQSSEEEERRPRRSCRYLDTEAKSEGPAGDGRRKLSCSLLREIIPQSQLYFRNMR